MECYEELAIGINGLKGDLETCASSSTEAQNMIEQRGYLDNIKSTEAEVAAIRSQNAQLQKEIEDAHLKVIAECSVPILVLFTDRVGSLIFIFEPG